MGSAQLQVREKKYFIEIKHFTTSFVTIDSYLVFISNGDKKFLYNFDIPKKNIRKYNIIENVLEKIILERTKNILESGVEKNISEVIFSDFIKKVLGK